MSETKEKKTNVSRPALDLECPPNCPVSKKCGGCSYQNVNYKKQLSLKQRDVEKLLAKHGHVEPIIGMNYPFYYRNKVHASFAYDKGKIYSGTYQESTHRLVPVDSCLIDDSHADQIIVTIRKLLKSFKIKVFDEVSGYGLVRHVLIRRGMASGQTMVVIVATSPIFPSRNNFVKALLKEHPDISTVVLNINDQRTSMILGSRNITLYGKGFITDTLMGYSFGISPSSFYQVNPVQTKKLYQLAMDYAALTGTERVIDAYCGIGTIGMIASSKAGSVIGIELNPEAVSNARMNAKHNNVKNITFYKNDATAFLTEMAANKETADVIFMDPPRAGSTESFIKSAVMMKPSRIVYISCNPDTLARDLTAFKKFGFKAQKIQPVDMFPWTGHVETVVLMTKVR